MAELPRKPPRPCLVAMGWFPDRDGGLNRYVHGLFGALAEAGAAPQALVTGPVAAPPPGVLEAAHEAEPLPRRLRAFARGAKRLLGSADVIDAHFALYAAPVLLRRSHRRMPLVVHFHGPWAAESASAGARGPRVAARRLLEQQVYRRADRCVVLSEDFARILVDQYGVDASRIRTVQPGVELDRFRPVEDRAAVRRRLGVDDGPLVLAVRRLVPRMGIDVLIDAWERVARDDARLVVVGDGPSRGDLEDRVRERGLTGRITFTGRVSDEDLSLWYAAADLTVIPSLELEGFGLVLLESLAAGTPVLASAIGGMGEALPRLGDDLVLPPGDVEAWAARLSGALDGTRPLPGLDACRRFAEKHSWSTTASEVLAVYDEAVAAARTRRPAAVPLADVRDEATYPAEPAPTPTAPAASATVGRHISLVSEPGRVPAGLEQRAGWSRSSAEG